MLLNLQSQSLDQGHGLFASGSDVLERGDKLLTMILRIVMHVRIPDKWRRSSRAYLGAALDFVCFYTYHFQSKRSREEIVETSSTQGCRVIKANLSYLARFEAFVACCTRYASNSC
jgi:hypothetical protein